VRERPLSPDPGKPRARQPWKILAVSTAAELCFGWSDQGLLEAVAQGLNAVATPSLSPWLTAGNHGWSAGGRPA